MTRCIVAVVCVLAGLPAAAQELRTDAAAGVGVPAASPRLDLRAIVHAKALEIAALQVPQVQQPPPATPPRQVGPERTTKQKALYFGTLAFGVVGTIFNIVETRDALDHHLEARTFPLIWKKTKDPADKSQVTGIIAGANGALMAIGGYLYMKGNPPLATFINVLIGGATTIVSLHDRAIINDCEKDPRTCGG
jgi:hypothetical protein